MTRWEIRHFRYFLRPPDLSALAPPRPDRVSSFDVDERANDQDPQWEALERLAADGWELVSVVSERTAIRFFFKRPMTWAALSARADVREPNQ